MSSAKRICENNLTYIFIKTEDKGIEAELYGGSSSGPSCIHAVTPPVENANNLTLRGEAENSSCLMEEENADDEIPRDWLMDDWDNTEGYDSISDEDDEIDAQWSPVKDVPFDERIRNWALTTYQSHDSLNSLLAILRKHTNHRLPEDAHTLLQINQSGKEIKLIGGGEFWYPGIRSVLNSHFRNFQPRSSSFSLNILINGLPLYKGSRKQYWPILMSIHEMPEVPVLMVGNFYGESNPLNVEQYLQPLVDELNGLMQNGIAIANKLIEVRVRAFITNSPARAFIKGVTHTNCNQVCEKCVAEGKLPGGAHNVYVSRTGAVARTNIHLNSGGKRKVKTPLRDLLHFDVNKDVIFFDCTYQLDNGVTRTFVNGLKSGKLGTRQKWSSETIRRINSVLANVQIPPEFHHKFRNIEQLDLWNGKEFNMFLHYASFVAFKNILTEVEYNHFMLYYCAITMFSTDVYRNHWPEADRMLRQFVQEYGTIYGPQSLTSNVHSLVHIYAEVCRFGSLQSFSSYPFQTKLKHVNRSLRNGHKVLVQAANRIPAAQIPKPASRSTFPYLEANSNGVIVHLNSDTSFFPGTQYNWFFTKDFYIGRYIGAYKEGSTIYIYAKTFRKIMESHTYHYSPLMKDIYEAEASDLSAEVMVFQTADIQCKLVAIKTSETSYVFVPILQTLTQ